MTSLIRLTDLTNAVDEYARELEGTTDDVGELAEAVRVAAEGFTRVAQAWPQTADAIEMYVARMAAALGVDRP